MATSEDLVNWVCTSKRDPYFLKHLLVAESETFLRFASGTTHQTIYFPEVKAFHICHPPVAEQKCIVAKLERFCAETNDSPASTSASSPR